MNLAYDDIILDNGWEPAFKWFVLISVVFHVAAMYFAVAVLPELMSKNREMPVVYTVNLVSLPPAPPPAPTAPADIPVKIDPKAPPIQEMPTTPEPEPAELVPVGPIKPPEPDKPEIKKIEKKPPEPPKAEDKPKPEPKPEPKPKPKEKRRVDPDRKIDQALARLEKKVSKDKEEKHLDQAMASLAAKHSPGEGESSGVPGGRSRGPVTELDARMRDYYVVLYNIISSNWNMPPENLVDRSKKLETIYIIRIAPSGKIVKAWFQKKSGQEHFDNSAEKAVQRSRLPRLPDVFKGNSIEVGLRFTPSGVKRK